jgi:hypothetical protein
VIGEAWPALACPLAAAPQDSEARFTWSGLAHRADRQLHRYAAVLIREAVFGDLQQLPRRMQLQRQISGNSPNLIFSSPPLLPSLPLLKTSPALGPAENDALLLSRQEGLRFGGFPVQEGFQDRLSPRLRFPPRSWGLQDPVGRQKSLRPDRINFCPPTALQLPIVGRRSISGLPQRAKRGCRNFSNLTR